MEEGKKPEQSYTTTFAVELPNWLADRLYRTSINANINIDSLMAQALIAYISEHSRQVTEVFYERVLNDGDPDPAPFRVSYLFDKTDLPAEYERVFGVKARSE